MYIFWFEIADLILFILFTLQFVDYRLDIEKIDTGQSHRISYKEYYTINKMGNTSRNTDEKQRAYKKAKKLRRKIRKAEELKRRNENRVQDKEQPSKLDNNLKWCRVDREDGAKKAVDRPLDQGYNEDRINELLEKRSAAKLKKNYKVSDEITQTLIKLQIIYDDDKKQWHTRQWKSNNF